MNEYWYDGGRSTHRTTTVTQCVSLPPHTHPNVINVLQKHKKATTLS